MATTAYAMNPTPIYTQHARHDLSPSEHTPLSPHDQAHKLMTPIDRGVPGDQALMNMVGRPSEQTDVSRRKSQFFANAFNERSGNQTKEQIINNSMVVCEMKTNVIVRVHTAFLKDMRRQRQIYVS